MNSFYFLSEKGMRGGQGSKTVQSKCNCLLETEDNRKRGDLQLQKKKKEKEKGLLQGQVLWETTRI